ncbi:MAG: hypothetical protein D6690_03375 [Nitrospirae bacterium]|nr:MAG: hypothetical protein D6690_03375 [Nitrospirota bacterium]
MLHQLIHQSFRRPRANKMRAIAFCSAVVFSCLWLVAPEALTADKPVERHLANIRQLTVGGKNAEAYFSFDGTKLIFQSAFDPLTHTSRSCYQIFTMNIDGSNVRRASTGLGTTTCGVFFPGGRRLLFSSTHLHSPYCPPAPPHSHRYRWPLDEYDIFSARIDGQDLQRLTSIPEYDAEATVAPHGKTIVFTSMRNGDLDLYTMGLDGRNVTQLTREVGYDGGAFFSPDSKRIVYRAYHPRTPEAIQAYRALLADRFVEPSHLEIFVMNADGSDKRQITDNGAANFAPFFTPTGTVSSFHRTSGPSRLVKESDQRFISI